MLMTSSTQKACAAAIRALHSPRPILHIATNNFQQVMAIMDRAFFHTDSPAGASARYLSLAAFRQDYKGNKKEERKSWLAMISGSEKVLHLTANADDELDKDDLVLLMDYLEQFHLWKYSGEFPVKCRIVVYGRIVHFPSVIESQISRIDLPELQPDDFSKMIIHLYKPDAGEMKDRNFLKKLHDLAGWYADQLASFPEHEVIAILERLLYAENRQEQLDHLFNRKIAEQIIRQEKDNYLKIHNLLDFQPSRSDIIGLKEAITWLETRRFNIVRTSFASKEDITKGLLLLGLPGTGKSLMAQCCGSILGLPLLKLDISKILDKYVGQSDKNLRRMQDDLIVAGAPCVLWIDELEKVCSGAGGDSGSSAVVTRLLGELLNFMQEMPRTVFIVATANNISSLPTEMFRSGRLSQVFSLMLPTFQECRDIMHSKVIHHLGSCTMELAGQLFDICSGLKEWDGCRLVTRTNPDSIRFLTGSDIGDAARDMTINLGLYPGGGELGGKTDAEIYDAMQKVARQFRVTADTRIPQTLQNTALCYVNVLEKRALSANNSNTPFQVQYYQADKVSKEAPENTSQPQCLKQPAHFDSEYDRLMFLHIGRAMDPIIRYRKNNPPK